MIIVDDSSPDNCGMLCDDHVKKIGVLSLYVKLINMFLLLDFSTNSMKVLK